MKRTSHNGRNDARARTMRMICRGANDAGITTTRMMIGPARKRRKNSPRGCRRLPLRESSSVYSYYWEESVTGSMPWPPRTRAKIPVQVRDQVLVPVFVRDQVLVRDLFLGQIALRASATAVDRTDKGKLPCLPVGWISTRRPWDSRPIFLSNRV